MEVNSTRCFAWTLSWLSWLSWLSYTPYLDLMRPRDGPVGNPFWIRPDPSWKRQCEPHHVLQKCIFFTPAGWKSSINGWKSTPISRPQFQKCLAVLPVSQATVSTPFRINISLKDVASERKQQDEDPFLLEEEEPDGRAQAAQQGCWILWNDLSQF